MDQNTLTEVLSGRHLTMEERARRGVWPHPPLRFREPAPHLATLLASERWFPRPWLERRPDEAVGDRTVIERQGPAHYVVRFEGSGPAMNLAESGEKVFDNAQEAAAFYLREELDLPGDLDGWRVVE